MRTTSRGQRPAVEAPAAARAWLLILCSDKASRLRARAEDLAEAFEAADRAAAPFRTLDDTTPEGARLVRYLAEAERAEARALGELMMYRRLAAEGVLIAPAEPTPPEAEEPGARLPRAGVAARAPPETNPATPKPWGRK